VIDWGLKIGYNNQSVVFTFLFMGLSVQEQIFDRLRKANKILIALPQVLTADAVASGLALKLFLHKLQKDVELVSSGRAEQGLRFLPSSDSLKSDFSAGKSLVIKVNTSVKKLDEISYQTSENQALIFLKSQGEVFETSDLGFSTDKFPVDVIVTLDAVSLESLGKLFEDHPDLFYETPKINIDHKAGNELYGAVNLVDVTATSVGEILSGLLEEFEVSLLDEDIATALLTGIITKTQSFQHVQTTPQAFLKASRLVGLGGRQQDIIKNLYKTKTLSLLKLWGRCLARLKTLDSGFLAYCVLTAGDFEKSQSTPDEGVAALKELVDNLSGYKLVAIVMETGANSSRILLAVHLTFSSKDISQYFNEAVVLPQNFGQYKIFDFILAEEPVIKAEQRLLGAAQGLENGLAGA